MKKLIRIAMVVVVSSAVLVSCGSSDKKSSENDLEQRVESYFTRRVAAYDKGDGSEAQIEKEMNQFMKTLSREDRQKVKDIEQKITKKYYTPIMTKARYYADAISKAETNGYYQEVERLCEESYNYSSQLSLFYREAYIEFFDEARADMGFSNNSLYKSPYRY